MGKKFVVRLTESELVNLMAQEFLNKEIDKFLGGKGLSNFADTSKSDKPTASGTAIKSSGDFPELDLNTKEGYEAYEEIADKFISSRPSNLLGITGSMLADSAKRAQQSEGTYVPVELALAQLAAEGGFSSNEKDRGIVTKNPFNVGNVDSGKNIPHTSVQNGIQAYYDLIAKKYLSGGKSASDLLKNFVNVAGNRYASNRKYEQIVSQIANQVKSMGQPIYAALSKGPKSDMA
jgi:hypothetical protein